MSDSAGVRFVRHDASPGPSFGLGDEPRARVGLGETADLTLFEVAGGALLPDGGFLVADGGNYRLVRWSAGGELVGTYGRRGDGPGEFQNISWIQPFDGAILTYDARTRRTSWFTPDGELLRSTPMILERPPPPSDDAIIASGGPLAILDTVRFIGYPLAYADPVGEAGPLPLWGDLAVFDTSSAPVRSLGRLQLMEWYEDPANEGFPLANRMETPRIHWSARGDRLAVAGAVGHRIDLFRDGSRATVVLEHRARLPFEPDSIPEEYDLAADSLQAYRDVRIDGEGRVWVEPAVSEGTDTAVWRVFSFDGARLGDLALPSDATVLDATPDRILLGRRGPLGEEYVELRGLDGPGG